MDWDHVEGRWDSLKGQVQGQWRNLTQDEEEAEREVDL